MNSQDFISKEAHYRLLEELKEAKANLELKVDQKTKELQLQNKKLQQEIKQRKKIEEKISSLNYCLANFSPDSRENIRKIINATATALKATTIAYSKVENNKLVIIESFNLTDSIENSQNLNDHICYQLMIENGCDTFAIDNVEETKFYNSDPNIKKFSVKSYLGSVVRLNNNQNRSLCAVFTKKQKFNKYDKKMISLLANFIEIEENRIQAQQKIINSYNYLAKINRKITILSNFRNNLKNNLEEICSYITNSATNFSASNKCLLYVFEKDNDDHLKSYRGFVKSEVTQIQEAVINSLEIIKKVTKTKNRLQIDLSDKLKRCNIVNLYQLSSLLALPLIFKNEVFGMMIIFFQNGDFASNQELEFFDVLINQASTNIYNVLQDKIENNRKFRISDNVILTQTD